MTASEQFQPSDAPNPVAQSMREAVGVWECCCGIWGDYFSALSRNATPEGVLDANTRLLTDSFDVYGRAAGVLLRNSGLKVPTLND
jgi:hypothetical protein